VIAKPRIVDDIGAGALLLPDVLGRALAANDRVKYLFALLQLAEQHADHPELALPSLREDREAARLTDVDLDAVIAGARREGPLLRLPHARRIHELTVTCLEEMLAPLEPAAAYRERLRALLRRLPVIDGDLVPDGYVAAMTGAGSGGESAHGLVLDLHRELDRLHAELAEERIGGASVFALSDGDRALVAAFTAGVASTTALKLEHPGLGTTALRWGDTLILQNDLGTSDTHVLVMRVAGLEVTIIHTDPHLKRARFFQELLAREGVTWGETRARDPGWIDDGKLYHLCSGRYVATDRAALERFLENVGSRLVFLIDWNRARKRLRQLVDGPGAIEVLRRAVEREIGHRAFLELGGESLVQEALERAGAPRARRLDELLGSREAAVDFLCFVLRAAAEGVRGRRSATVVAGAIASELGERLAAPRGGPAP
jgi:hypothetical protein